MSPIFLEILSRSVDNTVLSRYNIDIYSPRGWGACSIFQQIQQKRSVVFA